MGLLKESADLLLHKNYYRILHTRIIIVFRTQELLSHFDRKKELLSHFSTCKNYYRISALIFTSSYGWYSISDTIQELLSHFGTKFKKMREHKALNNVIPLPLLDTNLWSGTLWIICRRHTKNIELVKIIRHFRCWVVYSLRKSSSLWGVNKNWATLKRRIYYIFALGIPSSHLTTFRVMQYTSFYFSPWFPQEKLVEVIFLIFLTPQ